MPVFTATAPNLVMVPRLKPTKCLVFPLAIIWNSWGYKNITGGIMNAIIS